MAILVALSLGSFALAQDPPLVGVSTVLTEDTERSAEFIGRVEALNTVDILTRIDGFLENRLFNEGTAVQKDQDLFLIERSSYEITLADAQAALVSAKATFVEAERQLQRNRSLINRQTIAQSILEQSETALETARSTVMSAEARVRQAELNLSYTRIKSPIDGRIGTGAKMR